MDRITDSATQMFDFVNQSMSWKTATLTAGSIALLAYHNEKRERQARAGNPSLMKVRIPAVRPSMRRERSLSRALRTSAPTGGIRKRSSGDASLMRSGPVRLSAQYKRADGKPCHPVSRPKPLPKKNVRLAKFLDAVTGALKEYLGYDSLPDESTKKPKRASGDFQFTPAPVSLFGPENPALQSPFAVQSKPNGPVLPDFNPFGPKLKSDYEAHIFGAKPDPPKSTWGPKEPDTQSPFTFQSQSSKPKYPSRGSACAGCNGGPGDKAFGDSCYANACRYPRLNSESMSFGSTKVNVSGSQSEPRVPDSQSLFVRDPFYTNRCFPGHVTGQQDTSNAESTFRFGSADLKPCVNQIVPRPSLQSTSFSEEPETPEAPVSQPIRENVRWVKCGNSRLTQRLRAQAQAQTQARRTSRAQKTLGVPDTRTVRPDKRMYGAVAPGDEHARAALQDKIEHYQNDTVCDAEMTVQNTHQPWRLVSARYVARLIPFDAGPDNAEWFFPSNFHTTYNVVAWILQRLSNETMTDYDIVTMLMKFGSDLTGKWVDIEYMVSYDHPSEWDNMQRDYWRAIEQIRAHTIPQLGVERRGNQLITAGEKYFEGMGWDMELPKRMREAREKRRREQAGMSRDQSGVAWEQARASRDQVRTRRDQPVTRPNQSRLRGDWSGLGGHGSRWFT